jgi:hypothetical protein
MGYKKVTPCNDDKIETGNNKATTSAEPIVWFDFCHHFREFSLVSEGFHFYWDLHVHPKKKKEKRKHKREAEDEDEEEEKEEQAQKHQPLQVQLTFYVQSILY